MSEPFGFSVKVEIRSGLNAIPGLVRLAGANVVQATCQQILDEVLHRWTFVENAPIKQRFSPTTLVGTVFAGSKHRFYPWFIEWGTRDQYARPAFTPAAQRAADKLELRAKAELERMLPPLRKIR